MTYVNEISCKRYPPSKDKNTPMKRKADEGGTSQVGRAKVEILARRCENPRKSDLRVISLFNTIWICT
ncbi:hypothetical protein SeLEV6574_g07246 [Synchytrium endobioticum]|uniref:Uncharacterized protein n=1 Tax=Synchytrium endobioticum TaxID=286115 RepID=A0A507CIG7_9FUNG|nr:hypothetical protein SeLEV6574_g07246 [Synchytrium endobioticum]